MWTQNGYISIRDRRSPFSQWQDSGSQESRPCGVPENRGIRLDDGE